MRNKLSSYILSLLLVGLVVICSFQFPTKAVPTGKTEYELLEQLLDSRFISYHFNTEQPVILSEPITIYYTTENYDKLPFSYYAGKSLSAFNLQIGGHLYFVKEAEKVIGFIGVKETDDGWQIIENSKGYSYNPYIQNLCIGQSEYPLIKQYETFYAYLESIGKEDTEIAYLWMYNTLECLFTPDLYNGYAINANIYMEKTNEITDAIYRTRDMALSIWNYGKSTPLREGYTHGAKWTRTIMEAYPVPQLLPEQHYSVTGFWCLMTGILVVLFGTAILVIRFIRRKKHN